MKYHYQYVSKTTVRIELIPEDQKEITLVESLAATGENDPALLELYVKGLQGYNSEAALSRTNFMNFPKVALCTYTIQKEQVEKVA